MKNSEKWQANLHAVQTFVATHNKYPSTTSSDTTEKSLAQWWSRQRYLLKNNKLSEEQKCLVEGIVMNNKNHERDGIWNTRYDTLVRKYKTDNCLFPNNTTDKDIVHLNRWWNQQKTFAKKFAQDSTNLCGGMTQDRYEKILALLRIMNVDLIKDTLTAS
jgi:hypothetical protein